MGAYQLPKSNVVVERRQAPRFSLCSLAIVLGEDGSAHRCTVEDLSQGGALLTGSMQLVVGEMVQVLLPLAGEGEPAMVGRVVRRQELAHLPQVAPVAGQLGAGGRLLAYGVMFNGASARVAADALQKLPPAQLTRPLRATRAPVLVVDASVYALAPTVAALGASGHASVAVTTAFDAVSWLTGGYPFAAAIVNVQAKQADGASLLRYLAQEHPKIRRVALYAEPKPEGEVAELISSAHLSLSHALTHEDIGKIFAGLGA